MSTKTKASKYLVCRTKGFINTMRVKGENENVKAQISGREI